MKLATRFLLIFGWLSALAVGCDRNRDPNDPSNYYGQQPSGYDQHGNPIYGQPGGQGQPGGYTQPGQPGAYPGQPPPSSGPPSPLALLPCQSDFTCGSHKCNLQYQRCAIPCQGPQDCAAGFACMTGACVPGGAPTR